MIVIRWLFYWYKRQGKELGSTTRYQNKFSYPHAIYFRNFPCDTQFELNTHTHTHSRKIFEIFCGACVKTCIVVVFVTFHHPCRYKRNTHTHTYKRRSVKIIHISSFNLFPFSWSVDVSEVGPSYIIIRLY